MRAENQVELWRCPIHGLVEADVFDPDDEGIADECPVPTWDGEPCRGHLTGPTSFVLASLLQAAKRDAVLLLGAEAERDALRETLEPFAAFADRLDGEWTEEDGVDPEAVGAPIWDDEQVLDHGLLADGPEITVADLRRARSLQEADE